MRILLIGGSGCLGQELQKLNHNIIAPKRYELDINDEYTDILFSIQEYKPDVLILAAAVTDNRAVEKNPVEAINTNIIATGNISAICYELNIRLVYISTDYIYPGTHGNCKETDPIQPFNLYSWTKLGGECSVVCVPNHLIIRTSFGKNTFDYKEAFVDKWSSKDYVNVIAPLILEAATSPLTGVLNLGTERKTLYDHASERSEVKPVKIAETNYFTPYDTSLNLQKWIDYKSSKSIAKPHCKCRVCGSEDMEKYLDLGLMPLANNLEFTAKAAKEKERFPLQVMFCKNCALSQLSVVIDPKELFGHYVYRSSVSTGYLDHCKQMAIDLMDAYDINCNSFHIDIAGNDGALLKEFEKVIGSTGLNVDPATNLVAIAESQGIESIADFWSVDLAEKILASHGSADLITATNVFAHLDDVKGFIQAARVVLKDDGILVIENPYLIDTIENIEFGQVYFEHTQYWMLIPLMKLCNDNGMKVIACDKQEIHSGSMRYIITKEESKWAVDRQVYRVLQSEVTLGYDELKPYENWSASVTSVINDFANNLLSLKKQGHKIAGFGGSAKGSTLLNCAKINTDIVDYICDETPEKLMKYSPGTGIPIVGKYDMINNQPDYLIVLAWNFSDEIMQKVRSWGYKGKFIIPIPSFKIID